jgi:hypothetical protein
MKKFILLQMLMLTAILADAQLTVNIQWRNGNTQHTGDTIYYDSERQLVWSDFKGKPDASSPAVAITESGFGYRLSMRSYNSRMTVQITVFCYFNKDKSWVKKGMKSNYALLHEQHHFDITYINAALFVKKLKAAHFTSTNYNTLVEQIHDECYQALTDMQNAYDGETMNGRIESMQLVWNKKIDNMLSELAIN